MLAAHLLIATLSVWWMWGGERAVFRLVRAVSLALVPRIRLVLHPSLPTLPPAAREPERTPHRALRRLLLVHVVSRRGPPLEAGCPLTAVRPPGSGWTLRIRRVGRARPDLSGPGAVAVALALAGSSEGLLMMTPAQTPVSRISQITHPPLPVELHKGEEAPYACG